MKKEIIINATLNEIRVAILENNRLSELFWELPEKERSVGNIYVGRVRRIIQGMNAAFVDIGLKQDAFLHFSDVSDEEDDVITEEDDDETEGESTTAGGTSSGNSGSTAAQQHAEHRRDLPTFQTRRSGEVVINLEEGKTVIVQAYREAYSSKGLRITTKISLPGRYLVLLPFAGTVGVSKKIYNPKERRRLRRMAKNVLPEGLGCIIRTEAEDKDEESLRKDLTDLVGKWQKIQEQIRSSEQPRLVHRDMDLAGSLIRDTFTSDITRLVTDSRSLHEQIKQYLSWAAPELLSHVELYAGKEPIFDNFGIEQEIKRGYNRTVSLSSGGYLIFDYTEAFVVIDVNSGRYAADKQQEVNALRTNLEAAAEIARQIRLRDIGGMIIIDFIDMQDERNRRKLFEFMKREVRSDRAKTVIFPLTQLGLMQITRQRVRQNIMQLMTEPCPVCKGTGTVQSKAVVINSLERWLKRFKAQSREFHLSLMVNSTLAHELSEGIFPKLTKLMLRYFVKITLVPNDSLAIDEFRFISMRQQNDITRYYL